MRVAILGCGPAGLMAAHAAVRMNAEVKVFSRKRKSQLFGAQYLHQPIPGVTDRDNNRVIEYRLRGSHDDYRRKVYGPTWDGTVSPEDLEEMHMAWDIRGTYNALWNLYNGLIENVDVDPAGVRFIKNGLAQTDLLVNTIPLASLCHMGHDFKFTQVVAAGDAPELGINIGRMFQCPPNTVICNGEDSPSWYRISNIFGRTTVEWPQEIRPPVLSASPVIKPTSHNCDCWPDMLCVGRYGSWSKGVLSHTAYNKTIERIRNASAQATPYDDPSMPTLF